MSGKVNSNNEYAYNQIVNYCQPICGYVMIICVLQCDLNTSAIILHDMFTHLVIKLKSLNPLF